MQTGFERVVNFKDASEQDENHPECLRNDEQRHLKILRSQRPREIEMDARCRSSPLHILLHHRRLKDQQHLHSSLHPRSFLHQQSNDIHLRLLPLSHELRSRTAGKRLPIKTIERSLLMIFSIHPSYLTMHPYIHYYYLTIHPSLHLLFIINNYA